MPPQRRRSSASAHAPVVPKVKLNDGTEIPVIGFGTGTALYEKDSSDHVYSALKHGYTYIDSAQMYGNAASVGDALKRAGKRREDVYVLTKFGQSGKSGSIEPRKVLIEQLELLGLDYVDMYLIHSPLFAAPLGLKRTWEAMEALRDEGLCKSIGVSNFREEDLLEMSESWKVPPAVNQIEFNPYVFHADNMVRLLELCKKHQIVIEAYGPLNSLFRKKGGPVDDVVDKLAKDKGATPAQILLAWARQKTDGVVVTTSRDAGRQKEQLESVTKVHLTDKEIESISEAGKGLFYRHFMGDVWEGAKA